MKTLLLSLSFVLFSGIAFGQKISKKEAYEAYKKSNVRIALGYKLSDFNRIYNTKNTIFIVDRESIILNSIKDKEALEKIKWFHSKTPCNDCKNIIYESRETAEEMTK